MTLQKQCLDADQIFVVPGFFSALECDDHVARCEGIGFEEAPITTAAGFVMRKDIRDNLRIMHDDIDLAATLYARIKPFLPEKRIVWRACGLNERFRFYRYDVGQKFAPHYDGSFRRSDVEESLFTLMIYLNDEFDGGATNFFLQDRRLRVSVEPEKGKALVFWHDQLHEGAPISAGRKYVLRTDVMYRMTA